MQTTIRRVLVRAAVALSALAMVHCGSDPDFPGMTVRPGPDASTAGMHDASTVQNTTPDALSTPPREGGGPTMLTPDAACAMQTSDTTRAPMNLLILLDRSGSMRTDGKWTAAVAGLTRLLTLLPDDTRVGLTIFPAASAPDSEGSYSTPAVPVGPLSTSRARITALLAATSPSGNTPMACAMLGSMQHLTSGFSMDGSRNIVLITDGAPTSECSGTTCSPLDVTCLLNAGNAAKLRIQAAVASGAMGAPPVRTFVVGTADADEMFLTNLAVNGNSRRAAGCEPRACHYSLGTSSFEMDLNRALDDIRGRAGTCEFRIMIDPSRVDPGLVNVNYLPADGSPARVIPRDVSHRNGWDYSADMRSIVLYGTTCDEVRAPDSRARIQILFGCPTIVPG